MKSKKKKIPQTKEHPPLHEQRRAASRCGGAAYLMVSFDFITIFGPMNAVLLTLYIRECAQTMEEYPEDEGWFRFLNDDIQEIVPSCTDARLSAFRKELKEAGILQTKRNGWDPSAQNWINFKVLEEFVEKKMEIKAIRDNEKREEKRLIDSKKTKFPDMLNPEELEEYRKKFSYHIGQ